MGIFSENCPEFYITELACISDSVTIVPISADAQFLESERVSNIIEATGLTTICVSSKTGGFLLDLKTNGKIGSLKIMPKIHKKTFGIRPVISNVDHFTYNLSILINLILKPFVEKTATVLKDSQNLIQIC